MADEKITPKRKVSEKSLKNLEKRKSFNKDNVEMALECQKKSVAKRKENKTLKQVAEEKLNKMIAGFTFQDFSIDKLIDYVKSEDAKPETILKILEFLRDTSGQTPTQMS